MPGRKSNNSGNSRGGRGYRGSNGRGRGHRQEGRGGFHKNYPHAIDEVDYVVQMYADPELDSQRFNGPYFHSRGRNTPRSRPGTVTPQRGTNGAYRGNGTPRGRGQGSINIGNGNARGRGIAQYSRAGFGMPQRGRGRGMQRPLGRDAPLSDLLYAARPLLRPVKFVRAIHNPFLFQESEDIFQPVPESTGAKKSDAPTAERVARVFSDVQSFFPAGSVSGDEASEELEEIDFADLSKLFVKDDTAASRKSKSRKNKVVEETFTGVPKPTGTHGDAEAKQISSVKKMATMPLQTPVQSPKSPKVTQGRGVRNVPVAEPFSSQAEAENTDVSPTLSVFKGSFTSHSCDLPPRVAAENSSDLAGSISTPPRPENGNLGFVIDTQPADPFASRSSNNKVLFDRTGAGGALGEEDEVIVYVAPYPRHGRVSPSSTVGLPATPILASAPESGNSSVKEVGENHPSIADHDVELKHEAQPLSLSSMSFNFKQVDSSIQPRQPPTFSPSQRKKAQFRAKRKEARVARRNRSHRGFGSFGAMMSEAQLYDADELERSDPKWETRRKDDSDIDWGDSDGADNDVTGRMKHDGAEKPSCGVDELSSGLGGMDLDPDVDMDVGRLSRFVQSMSAEGSRFVTMDDIEDEQRMREEDDEDANMHVTSSSSDGDEDEDESEDELAFQLEEEFMVAESERESSDEELATIKKRKSKKRVMGDGEDEDDYIQDSDDDLLADIQELLEEHGQCFSNRNWRDTLDYAEMRSSAGRKKNKYAPDYLSEDLKAQWARDRAKKAENKQRRKQARMLAALDITAPKKGGKKAHKLIMAAFNQLSQTTNHPMDMSKIESLMREFVANIGGRKTISLPPMDKGTRKAVHELATAFNLKSLSKGGGLGRYVTLTKTTWSGTINEGKVKALMKRAARESGRGFGGQKGGRPQIPAHREGDEVGKEAPVVGESNIGFKMLSSMGWAEGVKIGGETSAGIEVPLTAVIKKSKLGLGASRT